MSKKDQFNGTGDTPATEKQLECIKRLRDKWGDRALIACASRRARPFITNLDAPLTKSDAQRIITCAPHDPIRGIYFKDSWVRD